jgi:hypothetical protein
MQYVVKQSQKEISSFKGPMTGCNLNQLQDVQQAEITGTHGER